MNEEEQIEAIRQEFIDKFTNVNGLVWKTDATYEPMVVCGFFMLKYAGVIERSFQTGRASAVSEIRDKMPKKKVIGGDMMMNSECDEGNGFNQYSDELDTILEGMEK